MIRILVDADACPVKEEIYRVAGRYGLKVLVVANSRMGVPRHPLVELKVVSGRFDAADDWIVEEATPADITVTSDIPLAARVLAKGARALDPKGRVFSPDSIGDALASREISAFLRDMGESGGGPAPFSPRDRSRFLQSLDTAIQSLLKAQRAQRPIDPEPA
ncbi:MAG: YaiI/YqxD family protein [Holophagaceae bacterium]|nr:YaiI/YqxD family protein [Holophagaceae bacterium]